MNTRSSVFAPSAFLNENLKSSQQQTSSQRTSFFDTVHHQSTRDHYLPPFLFGAQEISRSPLSAKNPDLAATHLSQTSLYNPLHASKAKSPSSLSNVSMRSESSGLTSSMISTHRSASLRSWNDKLGGLPGSVESTSMGMASGKQKNLPPTLSLSDLYFSTPRAPGSTAMSDAERERGRPSENMTWPNLSSQPTFEGSDFVSMGFKNPSRHESELPEGIEAEKWTTIFGFPPSQVDRVLLYFKQQVGEPATILTTTPTARFAGARAGPTWIHIGWPTEIDASKASSKEGTILSYVGDTESIDAGSQYMIGVMPFAKAKQKLETLEHDIIWTSPMSKNKKRAMAEVTMPTERKQSHKGLALSEASVSSSTAADRLFLDARSRRKDGEIFIHSQKSSIIDRVLESILGA